MRPVSSDSPPPRGRACRSRFRSRSVPISGVDPPLSPTTAREGCGPAGRPPVQASWPLQVRGSTQCIRAAPGDSQAQATRVPSRGQAGQIAALGPRPRAAAIRGRRDRRPPQTSGSSGRMGSGQLAAPAPRARSRRTARRYVRPIDANCAPRTDRLDRLESTGPDSDHRPPATVPGRSDGLGGSVLSLPRRRGGRGREAVPGTAHPPPDVGALASSGPHVAQNSQAPPQSGAERAGCPGGGPRSGGRRPPGQNWVD